MKEKVREAKAEYVHSVFESIAADYDRMNSVISLGMHRLWRKKTLDKMDIQPGHSAVDICCGTADWSVSMANIVGAQGDIVGLDFSKNMLEVGDYKLKKHGLENRVELVQGDALNLPFPDNRFDFATIGFALRNVTDISRALSEMARVVKPGGKVVSLEVSKPPFIPYRRLFYFYFYHILPRLGNVFAGKHDEYQWLPQSLTYFPDSKALAGLFRDAGLDSVQTRLFAGGASALHIGIKKELS